VLHVVMEGERDRDTVEHGGDGDVGCVKEGESRLPF
jgi:hypothetical protein